MPSPLERKELLTEAIYHAFNRGVEKRQIFMDGHDYRRFLHLLQKCLSREPAVTLLAYALMPNHYHLLIGQSTENRAVSRFMQSLGIGYVKYFNARHRRVGPLFQGKYKADRVVGAKHLMDVSRYVHLNPLDAGLGWWHYQYSSIDAYVPPFPRDPLVDTGPVLQLFDLTADYHRFLYTKLRYRGKNTNNPNA